MPFHLLLIDEDSSFTQAIGLSLQRELEQQPELAESGWKVWTANSWNELVAFPQKPHLLICGSFSELSAAAPVVGDAEAVPSMDIGATDETQRSTPFLGDTVGSDPDVCRVLPPRDQAKTDPSPSSFSAHDSSDLSDASRSDGLDGERSDSVDPDRSDTGISERTSLVRRLLSPGEVFDLALLSTVSRCARHFPEAAVAAMVAPHDDQSDESFTAETRSSWDLACTKVGAWGTVRRDRPVQSWVRPLRKLAAMRSSRRRIVGPLGSHRRTDSLEADLTDWIGGTADVAERIYSLPPLRDRMGDQFGIWVDRYISVIHVSREARIVDAELNLGDRVLEIARELFVNHAGSRDVMAIHREATRRISQTVRNRNKRAGLLVESRLILTAVLGRLVSFYRTSSTRPASTDHA